MDKLGQDEMLKRYTNVKSKQKEEAEAIDQFLVDMAKEKGAVSALANATQKSNSSRSIVGSKTTVVTGESRQKVSTTSVGAVATAIHRKPLLAVKLDRKQIFQKEKISDVSESKVPSTTATSSKTDKLNDNSETNVKNRQFLKARRRYVPGGGSMMNLVQKSSTQANAVKTAKPIFFGAQKKMGGKTR